MILEPNYPILVILLVSTSPNEFLRMICVKITRFFLNPGLCGSALFGKFYVLNNVERESLQTSVYVCLTFEAYQL